MIDSYVVSEIHDRKLMVAYALRVSPHQFESKCSVAKEQGTTPVFTNNSSTTGGTSGGASSTPQTKINVPKVTNTLSLFCITYCLLFLLAQSTIYHPSTT